MGTNLHRPCACGSSFGEAAGWIQEQSTACSSKGPFLVEAPSPEMLPAEGDCVLWASFCTSPTGAHYVHETQPRRGQPFPQRVFTSCSGRRLVRVLPLSYCVPLGPWQRAGPAAARGHSSDDAVSTASSCPQQTRPQSAMSLVPQRPACGV